LNHLPQAVPPSLHFGNGQSARLFVDFLKDHRVWQTSRQKQFRDLPPRPAGAGRVGHDEMVPLRAAARP
jgi:hypothetical protein